MGISFDDRIKSLTISLFAVCCVCILFIWGRGLSVFLLLKVKIGFKGIFGFLLVIFNLDVFDLIGKFIIFLKFLFCMDISFLFGCFFKFGELGMW